MLSVKRWMACALAVAAVLMAPAAAQAAWVKAESPRFEVYGEVSESVARTYILELESFDSMLRLLHGLQDKPPSTKFKVYLIKDRPDLRRVWPDVGDAVAGFYMAGTEDVFAVALIGRDGSNTVQHEYVHHFMLQYFPYGYPAWLIEGYAEYYATTDIRGDVVEVGEPNAGRISELDFFSWLPMSTVLNKGPNETRNGPYYAQAWLMTHYFMSDPARYKQLQAYLRAVGKGENSAEAMERITGLTSTSLAKALRLYPRPGWKYNRYTRHDFVVPTVTVSPVTAADEAVLLEAQSIKRGVRKERQAPLIEKLKRAVATNPGARLPRLTLAHAQISFGDRAAGEAILRELVAADPRDVEALEFLAESRRYAGDEDEANAAAYYRESEKLIGQAYKVDPNRFQTLYAFTTSQRHDPNYPSKNTLEALLVAQELAPQVDEITLEAARGLIRHKQYDQAVRLLTPVANDPHGGGAAEAASKFLAQIATAQAPDGAKDSAKP